MLPEGVAEELMVGGKLGVKTDQRRLKPLDFKGIIRHDRSRALSKPPGLKPTLILQRLWPG